MEDEHYELELGAADPDAGDDAPAFPFALAPELAPAFAGEADPDADVGAGVRPATRSATLFLC